MKTPSLILMTIILCNLSIPINAQILTSRQQKEDLTPYIAYYIRYIRTYFCIKHKKNLKRNMIQYIVR